MRARRGLATALMLSGVLAATPAEAAPPGAIFEETSSPSERRHALVLAVDAQGMIGLQTHYLHRFPRALAGRHLLVGGGVELPLALWIRSGPRALRLSAHSAAEFGRWGPFGISGQLSTRLSVQSDMLGTRVAWDLVARALPGFHFRRGSLGLQLSWQQALATHVRHSSLVAAAFDDRYPEGVTAAGPGGPRRGWIAFAGTRFPIGLYGAGRPTSRVSIFASASLVPSVTRYRTGLFGTAMVGVLPFAVDLGVTVRLGGGRAQPRAITARSPRRRCAGRRCPRAPSDNHRGPRG